jgi:hypothetical protein
MAPVADSAPHSTAASPADGDDMLEPEIVDAELVDVLGDDDEMPLPARVRSVAVAPAASLPAVQAAAAAATGFVAGAATIALVRRHSARRLARHTTRRSRAVEGLPIVGSRSFLVDVHLIAKPGE